MLECLADEDADLMPGQGGDGCDVLVAPVHQFDQALAEPWFDFAEVFPVETLYNERAVVSLQRDLVPRRHASGDFLVRPDEGGNSCLAGLFDEHLRGELLAGSTRRGRVAQGGEPIEVFASDGVHGVDLQRSHVGVTRVAVTAKLRHRLAEAVEGVDISWKRLDN